MTEPLQRDKGVAQRAADALSLRQVGDNLGLAWGLSAEDAGEAQRVQVPGIGRMVVLTAAGFQRALRTHTEEGVHEVRLVRPRPGCHGAAGVV